MTHTPAPRERARYTPKLDTYSAREGIGSGIERRQNGFSICLVEGEIKVHPDQHYIAAFQSTASVETKQARENGITLETAPAPSKDQSPLARVAFVGRQLSCESGGICAAVLLSGALHIWRQ
jgi:hypothetical protein